ncbi:MAG: GFA family protein [Methylococcaceae bacterium]
MPYKGECLCGGIKYEVDNIAGKMAHCYCIMCRKFHGAAYSTFAEVKIEHFRWLQGKELLKSYLATNGTTRQFCSVCGSSMTFSSSKNSAETVEFSLGTLDSEILLSPDAHVHVASKANWTIICDNLPQYDGDRGS